MDRGIAQRLDLADPLALSRSQFNVEESGPIYLDGNSLGRPAKVVIERLADAVRDWSENLVGGWSRWIDLPAAVGDRIGRLIGAGPGQVVVCDSTTVNLYKLAASALAARADRQVILADAHDFPTDRYVLQGLAESTGFELRLLEGSVVDGLDTDVVAGAIGAQTALVCLSHVNFRSGARLDVAAITEAAHRHGALVLWDLCHSAGAFPVALDDNGVDLAVGCTYKYLNGGPGSPAFAYVRRDLQAELRQPIWGWFGQHDQFSMAPIYQPDGGMSRFLTGTPPVLGLLGVDAAAEILESAGIRALWAKSERCTEMLVDLVRARAARCHLGQSIRSGTSRCTRVGGPRPGLAVVQRAHRSPSGGRRFPTTGRDQTGPGSALLALRGHLRRSRAHGRNPRSRCARCPRPARGHVRDALTHKLPTHGRRSHGSRLRRRMLTGLRIQDRE